MNRLVILVAGLCYTSFSVVKEMYFSCQEAARQAAEEERRQQEAEVSLHFAILKKKK